MNVMLFESEKVQFKTLDESLQTGTDGSGELPAADARSVTMFVGVETSDGGRTDAAIETVRRAVDDHAACTDVSQMVIYPYACLSDDPASSETAAAVIDALEDALSGTYECLRAPFGWETRVEIWCDNHRLSVLAEQDPAPNDVDSSAVRIMTPDGDIHSAVDASGDVGSRLRALIETELDSQSADRSAGCSHRDTMQESGFADFDQLSDDGNLRYYPRGTLVRDLLAEYIDDRLIEYGGRPVETPLLYDLEHPSVREYADESGDHQYLLEAEDRSMMLRFAACFGQFSMLRDLHIRDSTLPLYLYELSPSFRRIPGEQIAGLKSQRAFTIPDMHSVVTDIERAKREFRDQLHLSIDCTDELGLEYAVVLRVTNKFLSDNRAWVESVVDDLGEPVLLEILPDRCHYWVAKLSFAAIDRHGSPIKSATVQMDVTSAERFDITYTTDGGEKTPVVLHYSPTGGIEQVIAALLERTDRQGVSSFPTWLAPTQVRFIPAHGERRDDCERLVQQLTTAEIRADIDARDVPIADRRRDARRDLVPHCVVVGTRTVPGEASDSSVRCGVTEDELCIDELIERVNDEIGDRPRKRRPFPRYVDRQINDNRERSHGTSG